MKTKQHGFTMIELIVVIAVLGILSAVAVPRFASIQNDARVSKLNSARGAVKAASSVVHGTVLARSGVADTAACPGGGAAATNVTGATGTVCTESGEVATAYTYPSSAALTAPTPGIIGAAGLTPTLNPTLIELNKEGYGVVVSGAVTTISVIGGSGTSAGVGTQTNSNCSFTYTAPTAANAAPVISATTITGC